MTVGKPVAVAPGQASAVLASPGHQAPAQFDLRAGKNGTWQMTPEQEVIAQRLPKKIAPRFLSMVKRGEDRQIRGQLAQGHNPFAERGAKFMQLACDRLLAGGITKKALREAFEQEFAWTEGTAASHVSICVALLPAIGAAKLDGRKLVLACTTIQEPTGKMTQ